MPFLAVASAGASVAKMAGISFKTPSEKRARKVIPGVVAAANRGNMAAVAILDTRRTRAGIKKERDEWEKGYSQISANVLAAYAPNRARYIDAIPAEAQSSPEAAASYATSSAIGLPALDMALAPINDAATQAQQLYREAGAQTAERIGVGAGAALAKNERGEAGPLDRVIALAQKPGGAIAFVVGGVALVAVVAYLAGRR